MIPDPRGASIPRGELKTAHQMAVASNKRVVYVGGLAEEVDEKVLQVTL